MSLSKPTGPRFLDPDQEAKILSSTVERYQQAVGLYIKFLSDNGFGPTCAAEHDDLMVEFKNAEKLSKAQFESLVAGVEFAQPQMEVGLLETRLDTPCRFVWPVRTGSRPTSPP